MVWNVIIPAAASLLGSSMAAGSARDAASTAARAERETARLAAEEARFRPVGITTRFGSSQFATGPDGRVSGASYELSPELRAYQDRLLGMAGGVGMEALGQAPGMYAPLTGAAERLFGLGESYLAQSPEDVAQRYMTSQLDILAPQRERQLSSLRNNLFQTGRTGLSVGATGMRPGGGAGLAAANPEMEAYYNAIAQQDAELAARAQEQGQRQLAFGTTLFGTGADLLGGYQRGLVGSLAPFEGYLGAAQGLESMGQQPLELGAALGGRIANPQGGSFLQAGGARAAQTMLPANMLNPTAAFFNNAARDPQFTDALSRQISRLFSRGAPAGSYTTTDFIP